MSTCLSPIYRLVEPSDTDFMFALYANSRAEEMLLWGWNGEQQHSFLEMQFRTQSKAYKMSYPEAVWQIIVLANKSVGSWIVDWSQTEIQLVYIALMPEHRNQGMGTQIIQQLLIQAQGMGKSVKLSVSNDNRAKHLYKRLGFLAISTDCPEIYTQMVWHPIV